MIIIEHARIAMLQPSDGNICKNEHGQKFIVKTATDKALFMEPYEGKRKPQFFAYTGELPSANS